MRCAGKKEDTREAEQMNGLEGIYEKLRQKYAVCGMLKGTKK